jgi:subtilisin-like proprotein convertase family protein
LCGATGVGACSAANAPGPTCRGNNSLTAFDGLSSPGTWTLSVCDDAGGDEGTLQLWELSVNGMAGDGLPVELVGFGIE